MPQLRATIHRLFNRRRYSRRVVQSLSFSLIASVTAALTASSAPEPSIVLHQDRSIRATFSQRVIIRVPKMAPPPRGTKPPSEQKWEERRAPRCIPTSRIAAAAVHDRRNIDLLTNNGERMRARLDKRCPSLDFYSGFYIRQTPDGQICADRDSIRTRSGATCEIDAFRRLVPDD